MECNSCTNKIKNTQLLKSLVFLSGIGILIPQIWKTVEAFIKEETTFTVSKKTFENMMPPTMLVCPQNKWNNGIFTASVANISDKDWHLKQFFLLNDKLTITMVRFVNSNNEFGHTHNSTSYLMLGENMDVIGKTFLVEEFLNPMTGMCYALTPGLQSR